MKNGTKRLTLERKLIQAARTFCIKTKKDMEALVAGRRCSSPGICCSREMPAEFIELHCALQDFDTGCLCPRWPARNIEPQITPIPPVCEDGPIPDDALCQEASSLCVAGYVACGEPAVAIVYHRRDHRSYYMCSRCADHNVRNRGGLLLRERKR